MLIFTTLIAASIVNVDVRIEQILPENAIAVLSIDNVSQLVQHLEDLGICEGVCEIAQTAMSGNGEPCTFTQMCTELQTTLELDGDIGIPNGHAGMGLYPVVDFEVGSVGLGAFMICEVRDSNFGEVVSKAVDQYSDILEIELETVDISGRDVWMVQCDLTALSKEFPMNIELSSLSQLYIAHTDGYLLVGTEPEAFASVFSALDGDAVDDSLATNDDYIELMSRCGSEGDLHGVLLLTNLADTFIQMDTSGMGMMILPTLKAAIGDIDGFAEKVSLSPSEGVLLKGKYSMLMGDGRNGVMALIGSDSPSSDIPSFVGEDTISYSQARVNYDKIIPWVNQLIAASPMLAMQTNPQMLEEMEAGIGVFTSTLGSETHVISTGSLPYSAESYGHLVAIECINEEQLSNVLGMMLPSMGATPADFLGNQIFTMDLGSSMMVSMGMNLSFSIAVGGGYALVGSSNSVENALRTIANPKGSNSNHGSNASADLLDSNTVSGWGYGDPLKSLEIQTARAQETNDAMFARMEEFDPEMAEEMRADATKGATLQNAIVKSMSLFLGPMSWNMSADENGFTAEFIMVKPNQN